MYDKNMKYLGKIILIEHDDGLRHPFIILWESKTKTIALLCSSVLYDNDKNEYSIFYADWYKDQKNKSPDIVDLDSTDGLKFNSQVDLNIIYIFDKQELNLNNIKNELKFDTYVSLINRLVNKEFQNKETNEMLEAAYKNMLLIQNKKRKL